MPYLHRPFTDIASRDWFTCVLDERLAGWWVARHAGQIVGYMLLVGAELDHLYVAPAWQGCGVGARLLEKAKTLSPDRLVLWTFQKNAVPRAFYEKRGFQTTAFTDGRNSEKEPDVQYSWAPGRTG